MKITDGQNDPITGVVLEIRKTLELLAAEWTVVAVI
jgi:hypothetical protein